MSGWVREGGRARRSHHHLPTDWMNENHQFVRGSLFCVLWVLPSLSLKGRSSQAHMQQGPLSLSRVPSVFSSCCSHFCWTMAQTLSSRRHHRLVLLLSLHNVSAVLYSALLDSSPRKLKVNDAVRLFVFTNTLRRTMTSTLKRLISCSNFITRILLEEKLTSYCIYTERIM